MPATPPAARASGHPHRLHQPPAQRRQARVEAERLAHADVALARRLYSSPQWRALRREVLRDHPHCTTDGCRRAATVVDHHTPHRGSNELFFDPDNLRAMCKPCHDRKTHTVEGHGIHQSTQGAGKFKRTTSDAPPRTDR